MTEPISVRRRPGRARLVLILGLIVAVAAAVGIWFGLRDGGGTDRAAGPIPLGKHEVCAGVRISVTTDARMRMIAAALVGDPQARVVYTQTKQQAYQAYRRSFADLPELQALGRPQALPAAVVVVTVSGADIRQVADRYRTRFTDATEVRPLIQDDPAAFAAVGATPPPPCPASGEQSSR